MFLMELNVRDVSESKYPSIVFLSIHKLFNQTVMGKQAFVKAYACFQTTASPRPFDYEYINIRLLS